MLTETPAKRPVGRPKKDAAPAPIVVVEPTPPTVDRVFIERTDERVLVLVHAFTALGYEPVVKFGADGTKTISV